MTTPKHSPTEKCICCDIDHVASSQMPKDGKCGLCFHDIPTETVSDCQESMILVEEKLGEILKLRRVQLNLKQADVAKKLGLSAMGLSYLERGTRDLKLEMLQLWAKELGLDVEIKLKDVL